jgi:hypothetical protein
MKRKRQGNDFVLFWNLLSNGMPSNLNEIYDEVLTLSCIGLKKEIPFTRENNIIRIELTPEICSIAEIYSLLYTFKKIDQTFLSGFKNCAIDVTAFQIVKDSDQQNEEGDIEITTDIKTII